MKKIEKIFRRNVGLLKKSDLLQSLFNQVLRLKNKKKFIAEVERRSVLDLFDYEQLSQPLPFCPFEKIKDSNYYGYVKSIKDFIGDPNTKVNIEHGLYFNDSVSYYANYKTFDTIMTFSDYRLDIIRKNGINKRLMAIGPYIHYAKHLLSETELSDIKSKLGKVLLYLPFHSTNMTDGTSPQFSKEVKMVEAIRKEHSFDTVIVCVYYRDFQYKKCIDLYKSMGFKITTAGHQYDINFISRLKSIISLADMTVSNRVGTNLGFCVYLGKPHQIINDYPNKYDILKQGGRVGKELSDAFGDFQLEITKQQFDIVNKYWGLDSIKTKDQILEFLSKS